MRHLVTATRAQAVCSCFHSAARATAASLIIAPALVDPLAGSFGPAFSSSLVKRKGP